MHRFYITSKDWNPDRLQLAESEAHHCVNVLRMKAGDQLTVFNGEGMEALAEIVRAQKKSVELRCISRTETPRLRCAATLAQAIPKGKTMDLVVQKATELGVSAIAPLLTERTIVQTDAPEKKQQKWQNVVIEAAKQCGQNWLPEVAIPQTLSDFFRSATKFDLMLVGSLQPGSLHLKKVLEKCETEQGNRPRSVLILIGPEGDLSPEEIALAISVGCQPITLGPIVLRAETAAIYCLSALSHELM